MVDSLTRAGALEELARIVYVHPRIITDIYRMLREEGRIATPPRGVNAPPITKAEVRIILEALLQCICTGKRRGRRMPFVCSGGTIEDDPKEGLVAETRKGMRVRAVIPRRNLDMCLALGVEGQGVGKSL